MNKVTLIGRLTKDAEMKTTSSGINYCNFIIAVDRKFKDANGNRQADFIACVAWRTTADFISKYFKKGNKIAVVGSIQTRSYEDQSGNKHLVTEVIVDEAEFVESKAASGNGQTAKQSSEPDEPVEMPFEL
jgi:single-strand DNA-binding protein